jgi:hypothetical protein
VVVLDRRAQADDPREVSLSLCGDVSECYPEIGDIFLALVLGLAAMLLTLRLIFILANRNSNS